MSAVLVVSLAVALTGLLSLMSFLRSPTRQRDEQPSTTAYILENTVTHARLLPTPATHAFSYPTLALLLSLDALEAGALDLGRGWLFGYGGTAWRVTGLRSGAYLLPDASSASNSGTHGIDGSNGDSRNEGRKGNTGNSIKAKLAEVLVRQGMDGARVWAWAETGDAWVLTMPSYVGYEGINPLTVYFCYARGEGEEGEGEDGALEWVVLEVRTCVVFGARVGPLTTRSEADTQYVRGEARPRPRARRRRGAVYTRVRRSPHSPYVLYEQRAAGTITPGPSCATSTSPPSTTAPASTPSPSRSRPPRAPPASSPPRRAQRSASSSARRPPGPAPSPTS